MTIRTSLCLAAHLLSCLATADLTTAFSPAFPNTSSRTLSSVPCYAVSEQSRREIIASTLGAGVASLLFSAPAVAASASQEATDKANILKGYDRLTFLLDNWDEETTVCAMGGDKLERSCDRTPMKVMDYMGFRATTDPLFKADKTMMRLYAVAPASRDSEYIDAVERYTENAEEANGMAFVSSWGEANPGGGKDRVQVFIERARNNVVASHESLATIIDILELRK